MANVPIYIDQDARRMVIGDGATLVVEGELEVSGGGEITPGADSITTDMLQDDAVTAAKALTFFNAAVTGTGMSQNIAHGLGATPSIVMFSAVDTSATMSPGDFTITPGSHTDTNIVVTATDDLVFQVLAWA